MQGIFESNENDSWETPANIDMVLTDSIAMTCLHILVSLVNQNMRVKSKNKKVQSVVKQFNRKIKIKKKMDSIAFNQLGRGYSVFFYDVVNPRLMVYDTKSIKYLIKDPETDTFEGIYQSTTYVDPNELKKGFRRAEIKEKYIPPENLILVPGIGKADGESLLIPAYPYVKAKKELVDSLYDLVRRLGLLLVVGVDLPGDVSDDDTEEYLEEIQGIVEAAKANSTWILPKETDVTGVTGSGEARVIESVKTLIEFLDEEIRKCLFVPDTFLSSLSANRATAKEQRYLISSMVAHIRDLIEESLYEVYDDLLLHHGLPLEYEFTWGNINLPDPEELFVFIRDMFDRDVMTPDEVRGFVNLGILPPELARKIKKRERQEYQFRNNQYSGSNIYQQMGYKRQTGVDK
jgi:hypothetical protein